MNKLSKDMEVNKNNDVEWESLSLVDQEGDFLIIEVNKSILLVRSVASKIIAHEYMPIRVEGSVQELLQILTNLR